MLKSFKNYFDWPLYCRNCHYKTRWAIAMIIHIIFHHKDKKLTMKDCWFIFRRGLEFRILVLPFLMACVIPLMIITSICFPFWWVYEYLRTHLW
jgi:hypothetical protein